jgi:hypothetical protein
LGGYFYRWLRIGAQPIGAVFGVLSGGLVVGQLRIMIGDEVRRIPFRFFLLANNIKCRPRFVQSPEDSGFAFVVSSVSITILPNLCTL